MVHFAFYKVLTKYLQSFNIDQLGNKLW